MAMTDALCDGGLDINDVPMVQAKGSSLHNPLSKAR
jgi:hypothetical protein